MLSQTTFIFLLVLLFATCSIHVNCITLSFVIVKVLTHYLEPIDILCPHFDNGITAAVKWIL